MVGLLPEESGKDVENEDLPTLIWRNGMDKGSVFAVVGDYLKDSSASGFLDGMLAEAFPYALYPVVNAQNLSMVDFPVFADENNGEIQEALQRECDGNGPGYHVAVTDFHHGAKRDEDDLFCRTAGGLSG